jgi:hypothetical protein
MEGPTEISEEQSVSQYQTESQEFRPTPKLKEINMLPKNDSKELRVIKMISKTIAADGRGIFQQKRTIKNPKVPPLSLPKLNEAHSFVKNMPILQHNQTVYKKAKNI